MVTVTKGLIAEPSGLCFSICHCQSNLTCYIRLCWNSMP